MSDPTSEQTAELAGAASAPELQAPPAPRAEELDLTSCDREPIHVPGSIQPHGFLIALNDAGEVETASASTATYLRLPIEQIFGQSLFELFGRQVGRTLLEGTTREPLTSATRLLLSAALPAGARDAQRFEVIAHRLGEGDQARTVFEFERSTQPVDIELINSRLYNFVGSIRTLESTEAICDAAVTEIRALTGCDRVVLYRFDEEGHGLVLAEDRAHDKFTSYLGLRFPASDVPAQARRMYELSRVRIIPNVDYEPSPLLSNSGDAAELDLSSSVLRSVSSIHREYMRNMGTVCSMSISIIIDGKLWGLVSNHHHEPRYVPLRLRSACDFVMQIVASQIESQQNGLHLKRALHAKEIHGRLLASMAAQDSYMEGLARAPELLRDLVGADGVAIISGVSANLIGVTPTEPQVMQLVEWLRETGKEDFFATNNLSLDFPAAGEFSPNGSGLIAIAVSKLRGTQVLWFRRELVQTVRWAGNPQKPAVPPRSGHLPAGIVQPRHSFEEWLQIVRGRSEPWTDEQVSAASDFRAAVLEIVLHRAEELADMAAGLQIANEELEAFSYSVSHDLRAPFRHISGFSEMLKEEEAARMSDRGRHYLNTIMSSAHFAGQLVDSLLEFSRFARATISMVPIGMEELVDAEWNSVVYDEARGRVVDYSRTPLPRVMGDPQLIRQVLRNLFSNAVKYSGQKENPRVRVEAHAEEQEFIFSITDNGVGFDQQYAGKLFGVFQRLHRMEDFEGTGIGLANVRRIINRHGGRVWAEGEVAQGATFFFTLPAVFPQEKA